MHGASGTNVFFVQALVEGGAAVALMCDTFRPQKILVEGFDSGAGAQVMRVLSVALAAFAVMSYLSKSVEPCPARTAFCCGAAFYHFSVLVIMAYAFAEGEALLLGAPLAARLVSTQTRGLSLSGSLASVARYRRPADLTGGTGRGPGAHGRATAAR